MPDLHFKGKEFVHNHHLTVPYRPLVVDPAKSIGQESENLIIHGDNLHALKALLPRYGGRVDCIFIDPPYNTGNENWNYSDNVNSEIMREWFSANPVNKEDLLRHDKWCCMMYPRLKLLRELLSDNGSFWITLDDNEIHRARMMLDEIFGEENFVSTVIWQKNFSPKNTARHFSEDHDYLLVYARNSQVWLPYLLPRTEGMQNRFSNPDDDPRGAWSSSDMAARNFYSEGKYAVVCPSGREIDGPPPGRYWTVSQSKFQELDADNRIWWGEAGDNVPRLKRFLAEVQKGRVPQTLWFWRDVGHTQEAKKEILRIMNFDQSDDVFVTPKPTKLLAKILQIGTTEDSIVLDSFAGSATTAHAVLAQNRRDGGNRKFILIECEGYADTLTAERTRRIVLGYNYKGLLKETLLSEPIAWDTLGNDAKRNSILEQVQAIENLDSGNYDKIKKSISKGVLTVEGEKRIHGKVDGLGGDFLFCTLGRPLDLDAMLQGESLPDYVTLGSWVFHTATGQSLDVAKVRSAQWYLGESTAFHVWMVYKPELDFLRSPESALTLSLAEMIAKSFQRRHLVFAPARFVPNKMLQPLGVEYAPLPFSLHRVERD